VFLDYLLYAPLGAAVIATEELPKLAERGRDRFERRFKAAELLGRFAVAEARRRMAAPPTREASGNGSDAGSVPLARSSAPVPTSPPGPPQRPVRPSGGAGGHLAPPAPRKAPARKGRPVGAFEATPPHELPIPAYDTLAASQVVERLASLTASELESVRRHESATRRRRTVLHRISQLNAERDGATA
jgi:hypothetical protein